MATIFDHIITDDAAVAGDNLVNGSPEIGTAWRKHADADTDLLYLEDAGTRRIYSSGAILYPLYVADHGAAPPATASYSVSVQHRWETTHDGVAIIIGIPGFAAGDLARYQIQANGNGSIGAKRIASTGSESGLAAGWNVTPPAAGETHTLEVARTITGANSLTLTCYWDSVQVGSPLALSGGEAIMQVGYGGIAYAGRSTILGPHIERFTMEDVVASGGPDASATNVAASFRADGSNAVDVSWDNAASNETAAYVHRVARGAAAPTSASTRTSPDLGADAASWADEDAPLGDSVDYYVELANADGSTFSATPAQIDIPDGPAVAITQPSGATVGPVPAGTPIAVEHTAIDVTDGNISANSLITSSNVADSGSGDGTLGTGTPFTLDTTGFTNGARTITVSSTNSAGATSTASFTLTIGTGGGSILNLEDDVQTQIVQSGVAATVRVALRDSGGALITANPLALGDVTKSVDGAAAAVLSGDAGATTWPIVNGFLEVPLAAAEVTGDEITLLIQDRDGSAYLPKLVRLVVVGYNPADADTAAEIRTELDTNSTKLALLDAAISTRLAAAGYTSPDNAGIASLVARLTSARAALLDNLDVALSTLATAEDLALVKAKTDAMTISSGRVVADAQAIAGEPLTGAGTENDPWRPA